MVGLGSLAEEGHRSLVVAYQGTQVGREGILDGNLAYQEAFRVAFHRAFLEEASHRAKDEQPSMEEACHQEEASFPFHDQQACPVQDQVRAQAFYHRQPQEVRPHPSN